MPRTLSTYARKHKDTSRAPEGSIIGESGFESVGDILKRMKMACEEHMTDQFDPALSLRLDAIEAQAQALRERRLP